jgi:hypothetical protein
VERLDGHGVAIADSIHPSLFWIGCLISLY